MTRTTIAVIGLVALYGCHPATAQSPYNYTGQGLDIEPWSRMVYRLDPPTEEQAGALGRVRVFNQVMTQDDVTLSFETEAGTFTFHYEATPNVDCPDAPGGCPDILTFVDGPPGYAAIPPVTEIPENGWSDVLLAPYLGF